MDELNSTLKNLYLYQQKIMPDYKSWSYCKSSNIVYNNNMDYLSLTPSPVIQYTNLYQYVELTLENVIFIQANLMASKILSGQNDYENHLFFLIENNMGIYLQEGNKFFEELTNCEVRRVNELDTIKNYLLIAGILTLGFTFLLLSLYLFTIDKSLNKIWDHLRQRIHYIFFDIKQAISDRLASFHYDLNSFENENDLSVYKTTKKLEFKHSLRYLIRFSFLFLFASLFIIISTLVFYDKIQGYLLYRPVFISAIVGRKIETTDLCFFTLENACLFTNFTIKALFADYDRVGNVTTGYESISSHIDTTKSLYQDLNIKRLMSSTLIKLIFESVPNATAFLSFGTFEALSYIQQESYNLVFNDIKNSAKDLQEFFSDVTELNLMVETTYDMANNDSKLIIENQLNFLIYFSVACCVFLIVVHLVFYCPFLITEMKTLNEITEFLKFIPNVPNLAT